jgi:hypothetical protein
MRPKAGLSFSGTFSWDKIMSLPGSGYTDPLNREHGTNHFYLDSESNQIRVNPEQPAGPYDPIW